MADETTIFRLGAGVRIMHAFVIMLFGALIVAPLYTGVSTLAQGDMAGLIFIALSLFVVPLMAYVSRDGHGRLGWRVEITSADVNLILPAGRSFLGSPPALALTLPLAAIASVEHRTEFYSALGIDADITSWALRLKDGSVIVLGDDRPVPRQPGIYTTLVGEAARAVAAASGVRVVRRDGVEARPGFLAIWGTSVPEW